MDAADVLRRARRRSGLSLRALGRRAGTSHATIAAYEHGRLDPGVATLGRIVRAAGCDLRVEIVHEPADPYERARELLAVLELAAMFPARHDHDLQAPVFGRSARVAGARP